LRGATAVWRRWMKWRTENGDSVLAWTWRKRGRNMRWRLAAWRAGRWSNNARGFVWAWRAVHRCMVVMHNVFNICSARGFALSGLAASARGVIRRWSAQLRSATAVRVNTVAVIFFSSSSLQAPREHCNDVAWRC
jgi:hypothetical protein